MVVWKEGVVFVKEYGCLFLECSAKIKVRVAEAFDELVKGILDVLGLLVDEVDDGVKFGVYVDCVGGGCC